MSGFRYSLSHLCPLRPAPGRRQTPRLRSSASARDSSDFVVRSRPRTSSRQVCFGLEPHIRNARLHAHVRAPRAFPWADRGSRRCGCCLSHANDPGPAIRSLFGSGQWLVSSCFRYAIQSLVVIASPNSSRFRCFGPNQQQNSRSQCSADEDLNRRSLI